MNKIECVIVITTTDHIHKSPCQLDEIDVLVSLTWCILEMDPIIKKKKKKDN